jgi:hypothetical protein
VVEVRGDDAGERIQQHREPIRAGLLALAAPLVFIGSWALIAPRSWWEDFPGFGRHWVSSLGPYDEHLVRDFAALYLGAGVVLVFAAIVLVRALVQGALIGLLIFEVPHLIFHSANTEPLSSGDNVVNLALLALGLALTVALLGATIRGRREVGTPASSRGGTAESTIEGGVGYGTR